MAVDGLFREFGEAFGRVFDHRPVVQGEISFFQREFEEKRGNREEARLQKSLEYGREINQKLIPQIIDHLQMNFPKFLSTVSEANDISQHILDREGESGKNEWLEQQQMQRAEDLKEFLEKMASRVCDIDKEFMAEVELVETHYKELEEKLKITEHKNKHVVQQDCDETIQQDNSETSQNEAEVHCTESTDTCQNIITAEDKEVISEVQSPERVILETDQEIERTAEPNDKAEVPQERSESSEQDNVEDSQEENKIEST